MCSRSLNGLLWNLSHASLASYCRNLVHRGGNDYRKPICIQIEGHRRVNYCLSEPSVRPWAPYQNPVVEVQSAGDDARGKIHDFRFGMRHIIFSFDRSGFCGTMGCEIKFCETPYVKYRCDSTSPTINGAFHDQSRPPDHTEWIGCI